MCGHVTLTTNIGTIIVPRLPSSPLQHSTTSTSPTNNPILPRKIPSGARTGLIIQVYAFSYVFHPVASWILTYLTFSQGPVMGCQGCFVSDPSSEVPKCFMYVTSTPTLANFTGPLALLRRRSPHPPLAHPPSVLDVTAACDNGLCP